MLEEQYTWDVYDPCTVLTIDVFDNGRYNRKNDDVLSKQCGKNLCVGKVRIRLSTLDINQFLMAKLDLVVFNSNAPKNALHPPIRPSPTRHPPPHRHENRNNPTHSVQTDHGHEVVQYMFDSDTHVWSMRKSKANWFRVVGCLTSHCNHVMVRGNPHVGPPTNHRPHPHPLNHCHHHWNSHNMDPRLSYVDFVSTDELDEEFDGFPTTRSTD
ncbi:unnamed protein product [Citrullus colocynthis]|uniref:Multiple C2 domain-containing protein n=1 Tax=Citrullus colocynthis TaxID=252529 RepID=A0ABP0YGK4_9ROSI